MTETVNHPDYYGGEDNPYEVIKVAEAWGFDEDAYLFNVLKYIGRPGKGHVLEDLKKAAWYLERKIARVEAVPAEVPEWTKPVPTEELPKTYECWGGDEPRRFIHREIPPHVPVSEQVWDEEATITVRYVRKSDEDPYPTATWSEYVDGDETAEDIAISAAEYMGRRFPERYRLKVPGDQFTVRGGDVKLKDFAKPGDVLFLVEV